MENETKNTAALEITSSSLKYAIGYCSGGRPFMLSYNKMSVNDCVENGKITNLGKLCDAIKDITDIKDEELKLKTDGASVDLILPPYGMNVFTVKKSTSTLKGIFSTYEITNLINMMFRESVPTGNSVVDVVLEAFFLDGNKAYKEPPLGVKTSMVVAVGKIFTLPTPLFENYLKAPNTLGLNVRKICVAPRCASKYISSTGGYPDTYFYVDLGGANTTVTTINRGSPVGSLNFDLGGDNLTKLIADTFGISLETASTIKSKYGYDTREGDYKAPIYKGLKEDGTIVVIQHKELNDVISSFFQSYVTYIENAIETLTNNHLRATSQGESKRAVFDKLPIVISGGTSSLQGLEMLLEKLYQNRRVLKFVPKTLGARDPEATNIIGCILAGDEHRGTNQNHFVSASLSREKR